MSEVDELRRQLAHAHSQLMARDRADAEARINTMAEAQKAQDETASAERQAALAAEIESTRRGAWVTALLKNAVATNPGAEFDPTAFEESIPKTGWPPGVSQSDFHFAGEPVLGNEADGVANTLLAKLLAELAPRKI